MTQYKISDIRLLWSEDERFLDQFAFDNPDTPVTFKVVQLDCLVCLLLFFFVYGKLIRMVAEKGMCNIWFPHVIVFIGTSHTMIASVAKC